MTATGAGRRGSLPRSLSPDLDEDSSGSLSEDDLPASTTDPFTVSGSGSILHPITADNFALATASFLLPCPTSDLLADRSDVRHLLDTASLPPPSPPSHSSSADDTDERGDSEERSHQREALMRDEESSGAWSWAELEEERYRDLRTTKGDDPPSEDSDDDSDRRSTKRRKKEGERKWWHLSYDSQQSVSADEGPQSGDKMAALSVDPPSPPPPPFRPPYDVPAHLELVRCAVVRPVLARCVARVCASPLTDLCALCAAVVRVAASADARHCGVVLGLRWTGRSAAQGAHGRASRVRLPPPCTPSPSLLLMAEARSALQPRPPAIAALRSSQRNAHLTAVPASGSTAGSPSWHATEVECIRGDSECGGCTRRAAACAGLDISDCHRRPFGR